MATNNTPIVVKELAVVELKQIYAMYNKNYDQLRTRILTILGAAFALVSFLYSSDDPVARWFIPHENYGRFLYALGALLILCSFVCLFMALHSTTWYYPMELKDLKRLKYSSKEEFISELCDEYVETITRNSVPYERKQLLYRIGLYSLIAGGIILMVINRLQK